MPHTLSTHYAQLFTAFAFIFIIAAGTAILPTLDADARQTAAQAQSQAQSVALFTPVENAQPNADEVRLIINAPPLRRAEVCEDGDDRRYPAADGRTYDAQSQAL